MARILIIDNSPADIHLATLFLCKAGHTTLQAFDAEAGMTLARTEAPDLILMDIMLPGMDGLAATALLKEDPVTGAIPVIAVSVMAMKEDREKARTAGCDAYIVKPLRYRELYAAIDRLLVTKESTSASRNGSQAGDRRR